MRYKNLLKVSCTIFALIVILYLILSYYSTSKPKTIPIIEPDTSPTRVKPSDAGGIIIPNADNIMYENMGKNADKNVNGDGSSGSRKINMSPEPEQALILSNQKIAENFLEEDSIDSMLKNLFSNDEKNHGFDNDKPENSGHKESLITENKSSQPTSIEYLVKSLNIVKVIEDNKKLAKLKNNERTNEAKFKIQLASMKTLNLAISEGERIKRKHQKILNNITITQKKVHQDDGQFFYIVLAGDYQNLSKAKAACKKLSAEQQSCMVYYPKKM